MYEYTPKPDRRAGIAVSLTCFLSMLVLFMPNRLGDSVALLLRMLGIWLFVVGYFAAARLALTTFTYTLEFVADGGFDLTVTETRLRKRRTVCRVSSSRFTGFEKYVTGRKKLRIPKGTRCYNYCPDLTAADCYLLFIEDGDGKSAVRIRPDEKMISLISAIINRNQR